MWAPLIVVLHLPLPSPHLLPLSSLLFPPLLYSENYIDGAVFLTLTEVDVKAMIPPLGLVKKIMKLVPNKEKEVCCCLLSLG